MATATLDPRIARFVAGTPIAPAAADVSRAFTEAGLPPALAFMIARKESSLGAQNFAPYNAWGYNVHRSASAPGPAFRSYYEAARAVAQDLRRNYFDKGITTVQGIIQKYAPPSENNTALYVKQLQDWGRQLGLGAGTIGTSVPTYAAPTPQAARGGGVGLSPAGIPTTTPATGGFTPRAMAAIQKYLATTERQALAGQEPDDPSKILNLLTVKPVSAAGTRTPSMSGVGGAGRSLATDRPAALFGDLALPLATKLPGDSFNTPDGPEGVPTASGGHIHGGLDWFAPAGARVVSPVAGRVVEVKPSRGRSGQVFGGVVKVQDADGRVFVFRHVEPGVRVGQQVGRGVPLARVTDWTGGSDHAHIEVWKTLGGGYNAANMYDPYKVFGGR